MVIREELPTIRYYSRKKKYIETKEVIKISTYIHFTKEQREQARRTDLAQFLISLGEKVRKSGSEYEWLDGSQKVTIRGNLWYHQYEQRGGDAVDFVCRFYNKDYAEAVEMLLNGSEIIHTIACRTYGKIGARRMIKSMSIKRYKIIFPRLFRLMSMSVSLDGSLLPDCLLSITPKL